MSVLRYFITSKAKRHILKLFLSHMESAFYTREVARLTGEPLNAVRRELGYLEKAGLLNSRMQGNLKYYSIVKSFPVLAEWQKIIIFTPDIEEKYNAAPAPASARPPKETTPQAEPAPVEEPPAEAAKIKEELPVEEAPVTTQEPVPVTEKEQVPATAEEPVPTGAVNQKQPAIITTSTIVDILHNEFKDIASVVLAIVYGEAARSETIPEDGIDLLVVGDISRESMLELLTDIEDDTGVPINPVRMTRSDFDYRNAKSDPLIRRIWSEKKLIVKGRY